MDGKLKSDCLCCFDKKAVEGERAGVTCKVVRYQYQSWENTSSSQWTFSVFSVKSCGGGNFDVPMQAPKEEADIVRGRVLKFFEEPAGLERRDWKRARSPAGDLQLSECHCGRGFSVDDIWMRNWK